MARTKIHHLMVKDGSTLVGVVSDRDLGGRRAGSIRHGLVIADVMTRGVVAVDRTATIRRIANVMRGRSIGCVAVTSGGRVVGIITVSDVLALLGRGAARPVSAAERGALRHRPHRKKS
jgi:acetoin utilization protein AcuB